MSEHAEQLLAVYFTPGAIQDAFDGITDDEPTATEQEKARAAWARNASADELREIGYECISADALWSLFHSLIEDAIDERLS